MTLVVADSSPILYLILIHAIDLLPQLYTSVVVPPEVIAELNHPSAPVEVQEWVSKTPAWVKIIGVENESPDSLDSLLDVGEAAAIRIAKRLAADVLLVDEREARRIAEGRGLRIAGTVGVLESAAAKDLINLKIAFDRLSRTNFWIDDRFLNEALARDAARRK